jgi:hypothetical protein
MAKNYEIPPWSGNPPSNSDDCFALEVIKEGAVVDTIQLNSKSHYILGRQNDIVDILLEHPSISRQHAVLQYRDDNALMCLDFNSVQGSFINKKPLEKDTYYRLFVGDIIKFGGSSRSYVVLGPESQQQPEYDSENLQKYRQQLQDQTKKLEIKKKENDIMGISWGFHEDAPQDDYPNDNNDTKKDHLPDYVKKDENYSRKYYEKYSANINENEYDKKDAQLIEKIKLKERKIQNMQDENRKIYMKENSQENGLTEGQTNAIERNDKRIQEFQDQIDELIMTLKMKNEHRSYNRNDHQEKMKRKQQRRNNDDDDDDLYDVTSETIDTSTNWRLKKKLQASKSSQSHASTGHLPQHSKLWYDSKNKSFTYEELQNLKFSCEKSLHDIINSLEEQNQFIHSFGYDDGHDISNEHVEYVINVAKINDAKTFILKTTKIKEEKELELKDIELLLKYATPSLKSVKGNLNHSNDMMAVPSKLDSTNESSTTTQSNAAVEKTFILHDVMKVSLISNETKVIAESTFDSDISSGVTSKSPIHTRVDEHQLVTKPLMTTQANEEVIIHAKSAVGASKEETTTQAEIMKTAPPSFPLSSTAIPNDNVITKKRRVLGPLKSTAGYTDENNYDNTDGNEVPKSDDALYERTSPKPSDKRKYQTEGQQDSQDDDHNTIKKKPTLQDGDHIWVPPKGQSGDGKTWLNAKLGY